MDHKSFELYFAHSRRKKDGETKGNLLEIEQKLTTLSDITID